MLCCPIANFDAQPSTLCSFTASGVFLGDSRKTFRVKYAFYLFLYTIADLDPRTPIIYY